MNVEEIQRAVKIHDYIKELEEFTSLSLKKSPIILKAPRQKVLVEIPNFHKSSYEYVEQLYEDISDHDLLFKALRTGWSYIRSGCRMIPKSKEEYFQQLIQSHAFHTAKERGYLIPDNFLSETQIYHGEYEAYYAVREIIYGNALGVWLKKANFEKFLQNYGKCYNGVKLITTQFIVPNSNKNTVPHILDQLWVISHDKNRVRLLGLEIDGEHHLLNGVQSKTLGKENYLKSLGYEMYHVASWWCRVDPYRVICEFLKRAGIFPNATDYLIGSELNSIDEYICGICCGPMVRWDWDWIQKCQIGNSTVLAHKSCVIRTKASTTFTETCSH